MPTKKKTEEIIQEDVTTEEVVEVETTGAAQEVVEESLETMDVDQTVNQSPKTTKAGKHSAKAVREAEEEAARLAAKDERAARDEATADAPKPAKRQEPNPLKAHGKKYREAVKLVERTTHYSLEDALDLAVKTSTTKFDSSVEFHINLGVDPRQADQMVRASVVLPHGTGKALRVAVFADGKAAEDAKKAGADLVGTDALLADIEKGKLGFDMLIATPDKMAALGKAAKVLGPRGLMPNPKSGTVTADAAKAVTEAKAGKIEFRLDKQAIIHQAVGKVSFKKAYLVENATTLISAVLKAKPSASKGTYVKAISVSTSMGPGIKVDAAATVAAISGKK